MLHQHVDTAITIFTKGKPTNLRISELDNDKVVDFTDVNLSCIKPPSYIIQINLLMNSVDQDILNSIENGTRPLSDFCKVSTGLKAYQIGKGKPLQTKKQKSERSFHSRTKVDKTYGCYLDGVDVCRYKLNWSGEFLSYGDWLAEPRKSVPFSGKRILVRQIPSKPPYLIQAVATEEDYFNDINSMVIFSPAGNISLSYLLGLINSKLLSYWFMKEFDKLQRKIFPQFKVNELARFPIPPIDFTNSVEAKLHNQIVAHVERIMELKKVLGNSRLPEEKERLERQIAITDRQIDAMVYELYGLTEEEIKIVEGGV